MKRIPVMLFLVFLLASCERPATITNGSPNNTLQPSMMVKPDSTLITTSPPTKPTMSTSPTPFPTLDFGTLPVKFPPSIKGYELLSWQVGEVWVFTMITGTNRNKTFEEIMAPDNQFSKDGFVKLTVAGVDDFKKVINRLPANEWVMWGGMDLQGEVPRGTLYFAFPPQILIDELIAYAKTHHITLTSLKAP